MTLVFAFVVWAMLPVAFLASAAPTNASCSDGIVPFEVLRHNYRQWVHETLKSRGDEHKCNSKTVSVRKEWCETNRCIQPSTRQS